MVGRYEAHRVLTEHLPVRDRRRLWLRWRCANCPERYPCLARRAALDELAAGIRDRLAPTPWWQRLFHRQPAPNTGRWLR
jgi:hypothetical protein